MRLRYAAEGQRIWLRLEGDPDDEHRLWRLLQTMGCTTWAEQVPGTLVWRRWIPRDHLPRLERAAKLVRWQLVPEAGEAVVAAPTATRAAYEAARPLDANAVLLAAKADPGEGERLLQEAIAKLDAWTRANPAYLPEARADLTALGQALQKAQEEARRRTAEAQQAEAREMALQLRGVAGEDAFAAHAALKRLQEAVKRADAAAQQQPPGARALPERIAHFRGKLRPYQAEGVRFLLGRGLNAILADDMGLGKAQPLDARVRTPDGWRRMGDLRVGDAVMGADGQAHRVTGVYPQGTKPVYRVTFSDGASTECCEDHLWLVNSPLRVSRGQPGRVLSLRDLTEKLRDAAGNARHVIPVAKPMAYPPRELPLDPYLLGCLLGDGGLSQRRVVLTTADPEILHAVGAALPPGAALRPLGRYDHAVRAAVPRGANVVLEALDQVGLSGLRSEAKHIPDPYLLGSVPQRMALLQGLLDTDGYASKDGTVQFTSVSLALAEGVRELVESLGGVARLRSKQPRFRHRGEVRQGQRAYTLTLALPEGIAPFRLPRKAARYPGRPKDPPSRAIVDVEPVGEKEVQCIAVDAPDHLYLTDHHVVTHNTVQVIAAVEAAETEAFVVCPANVLYNWKDEVERFTDESAAVYHEGRLMGPRDARFLLTTYDALQRVGPVEDDIARRPVLVLDEAHYVRNPETLRSQLVRALPQQRRVLLTGTPLVNTIEDYYELLRQVEPDRWGSRSLFRETWLVDPVLFNKYTQVRQATATLLQRAARDVMLRRRKDQVLQDLPPRTIGVNHHELPPDRLREYRALEARAEETFRREAGNELAIYAALHGLRHHLAVSRIPVVLERVRELRAAGESVVVYSHYLEPLHTLAKELGKDAAVIEGATAPRERQAIAKRLGADGAEHVLLAQMEAGGVGLNFTAARHVVFVHFGWTPAVHMQAMDRVHRIGQDRPVLVEFYVTPATIDERMVRILLRKEADQNLVLADESDVLNRAEVARILAEDAAKRVAAEQAAAGLRPRGGEGGPGG